MSVLEACEEGNNTGFYSDQSPNTICFVRSAREGAQQQELQLSMRSREGLCNFNIRDGGQISINKGDTSWAACHYLACVDASPAKRLGSSMALILRWHGRWVLNGPDKAEHEMTGQGGMYSCSGPVDTDQVAMREMVLARHGT
jgi:hypothetical protein